MPIRSRGDAPVGTIRELGLPARAVTALTQAGITRIDALAGLTQRDLAAVPGLGPGMIAAIRLVVPEPATRAAPVMPSFDSLRGPRRRSAVDVLLPDPPDLPPGPSATEPAAPVVPRPAEYADLLLLAVRGIRGIAVVPWRVARWVSRGPVSCLRRLLGDDTGAAPDAGGDPRPERR
jgi:hypothetical protein